MAHALWALVLLKCLTPPIIASPTSPFSWWESSRTALAVNAMPPETTFDENTPRISYAVERTAVDHDRTTLSSPTDHVHSNRNDSSQWDSWCNALLCIWIASCLGWLIYHLLRFRAFAAMVDRTSIAVPAIVQNQLEALRLELGVRTRVQLCVVDSLVGPAIMGIFHPRLIVPRIIVEQVELSQLRILLAHELIHVRRGDLWWSCLHVVARSCWWFHPAVWLTLNRQAQEAEDCCDAETIRGLRCTPAHYARSLISVLETKQQLAAAPFVPGLRPIDITSLRMKKIMRSGQGNHHARTPLSVHGCLLLGALVALPGAAWLRGQEPVAKQAPDALPVTLPIATPATTAIPPRTAEAGTSEAETSATEELFTVKIVALEMPTDQVREFRKTTLGHASQLIDQPQSVQLAAARKGQVTIAPTVYSDLGVEGQLLTNHPWLLSNEASKHADEWIREHQAQGVQVISRPRLAMVAGQNALFQVYQQHPFVTDVDPSTGQPTVEVTDLGLTGEFVIKVVERQTDQSADSASAGSYLNFSYKLSRSSLNSVHERNVTLADGRTEKVQQPDISTQGIERTLNIPRGITLVDTIANASADGCTTLFVINVQQLSTTDASPSLESPAAFPIQRRKAHGKVELRQPVAPVDPPTTRDPRAKVQAGDVLLSYARILSSQSPYSIQHGNEIKAPAYPITVLENGSISLPLLDPIHVEGLAIDEIERTVADAYVAAKIVKKNEIEVIFAKKPNAKND